MNFKQLVEKEIAKHNKMGLDETFLFIPNDRKSIDNERFIDAEAILQEYHDAGHFVKVEPSKTEYAVGNYVTISNAPVEEVCHEG